MAKYMEGFIMKKKILAIFLVVAMVAALAVGLTACKKDDGGEVDYSNIKIGMLCLHDKNSTYDKNFITAMEEVQRELGLRDDQVIIKTGIPEDDTCYQEAMNLVDAGCNIIFADSFGHEAYMLKAAKQAPKVLFAHATGTRAHTENLPNFVNAFASIYEGRFLAGVAAGLKLNEMIAANKFTAEEAKMGYVGAYTYAEVISGYTSFYLGAKSVCPTVTMDVTFTGTGTTKPLKATRQPLLLMADANLSANTLTPWAHLTLVKQQKFPTYLTTAALSPLAPIRSSFLPESTGRLTTNTLLNKS